jgi:hypothetical protein
MRKDRRPRHLARDLRAPATLDEQERSVTLLLLGKAAVLVRRLARALAAELDETEQLAEQF